MRIVTDSSAFQPVMSTSKHTQRSKINDQSPFLSSLALSLLRHSAPPSDSFVLSPFSLNTALSIIHDGAGGSTQEELTKLLLDGYSPSEVTDLYSSLILNPLSARVPWADIVFKTANRFYVDDIISLKSDYQKDMESKYRAQVLNLNLKSKVDAAKEISSFVEKATDGFLEGVVTPQDIKDDAKALLINATYINGKWCCPFQEQDTHKRLFRSDSGDREMDFMKDRGLYRFDQNTAFGTVLVMKYQDENYNFFYIMPKESSNLEQLRRQITGPDLVNLLKGLKGDEEWADITVPKFTVDSKLDTRKVLTELAVKRIFSDCADFSKVSSTALYIDDIQHAVSIKVDEEGTIAAAATVAVALPGCCLFEKPPPSIIIDRPFLFGIVNYDFRPEDDEEDDDDSGDFEAKAPHHAPEDERDPETMHL
ncbi:hypothetical protein PMAYCL1PPCAC_03811, partial [Pristionchus mayeri]